MGQETLSEEEQVLSDFITKTDFNQLFLKDPDEIYDIHQSSSFLHDLPTLLNNVAFQSEDSFLGLVRFSFTQQHLTKSKYYEIIMQVTCCL